MSLEAARCCVLCQRECLLQPETRVSAEATAEGGSVQEIAGSQGRGEAGPARAPAHGALVLGIKSGTESHWTEHRALRTITSVFESQLDPVFVSDTLKASRKRSGALKRSQAAARRPGRRTSATTTLTPLASCPLLLRGRHRPRTVCLAARGAAHHAHRLPLALALFDSCESCTRPPHALSLAPLLPPCPGRPACASTRLLLAPSLVRAWPGSSSSAACRSHGLGSDRLVSCRPVLCLSGSAPLASDLTHRPTHEGPLARSFVRSLARSLCRVSLRPPPASCLPLPAPARPAKRSAPQAHQTQVRTFRITVDSLESPQTTSLQPLASSFAP